MTNNMFTQQQAETLIRNIMALQARPYEYTEFFHILKRRLRIYTGDESIMFYGEIAVARLLVELGITSEKSKDMAK